MSVLSVRNLPASINKALENEAKKKKTTKTQIVISALRSFLQLNTKDRVKRRDVRSFFKLAKIEDSRAFGRAIKDLSRVDKDLW